MNREEFYVDSLIALAKFARGNQDYHIMDGILNIVGDLGEYAERKLEEGELTDEI